MSCKEVIFPLLETTSSEQLALVYFFHIIIRTVIGFEHGLQLFEDTFLEECPKRVNDDVWSELSLDFIKLKPASKNEEVTHEKKLNGLCTQILKLAKIRTGSGHSSDVTAKTSAAVRGVKVFKLIYRNPPKAIHALNSALRAHHLRADQTALRTVRKYQAVDRKYVTLSTCIATAGELFETFLVNCQVRRSPDFKEHSRTFNG